jgi:hypothetical protein
MITPKIILLLINLLGGAAVIGSYVVGLSAKHGGAVALWGGTPAQIRPFYTVSMVLAALGYFAFIYFILFKLSPDSSQFNLLYLIFLGILAPSAFWMPLANMYLANPILAIWVIIRIVLAIVGISSCALVWLLVSLNAKETGIVYWLAVWGSVYFAFHTTILDAILWPIFFKTS